MDMLRELSPSMLKHLTEIDYHTRLGFHAEMDAKDPTVTRVTKEIDG
jgi:hypothetical protein